jgi:hypothetical protein
MAWETVILKVPGSKNPGGAHKQHTPCPKCAGKLYYTIPSPGESSAQLSLKQDSEVDLEFHVLVCDRCGQVIAFENCAGDCTSSCWSTCEICGKDFCKRCGISIDPGPDHRHVELHYCYDDLPEWYANR